MTDILTTKVALKVQADQVRDLDLGDARMPLNWASVLDLANGTGANQANQLFHDQRSLAAGASENLDLAGSLIDAFGRVITLRVWEPGLGGRWPDGLMAEIRRLSNKSG
jgi:hypothetical protein